MPQILVQPSLKPRRGSIFYGTSELWELALAGFGRGWPGFGRVLAGLDVVGLEGCPRFWPGFGWLLGGVRVFGRSFVFGFFSSAVAVGVLLFVSIGLAFVALGDAASAVAD